MTRWLDSDEQRAWRAFLEATQRVFADLERQLQHDSGLSQSDYEVLVQLSESPERRMRMSELADRTLSSRSRLSHAVGRLETEGLLRRTACATDRRGTFAELTDAGQRRIEEAAPGHVAEVRRQLFDHLSPDQVAQLEALCTTILNGRRGA